MALKSAAPASLENVAITPHSNLPLHRQLQGELRRAIDTQFVDGQPFWTEATLAGELGVSRGTVRQALQELTREGLLVRRPSTGSVVCKPTVQASVTVIVPEYQSDFFSAGLEQLTAAAVERDRVLQIQYLRPGQDIPSVISQVKASPLETRVVFLGSLTRELDTVFKDNGYETISMDRLLPGYQGRYIGTDNADGVRQGMEYLCELGHRDIALLVNEPEEVLSVRDRIEAFEEYSAQQRLNARIVRCQTQLGEDSFDAALAHMEEVWQEPRPTAIFSVSETGSWAALQWLSRREVRVPDQVSVLSFGDLRIGRFTHPPLSTVAHPLRDIAHRALDLLFDPQPRQESLPPLLIVRESTGPAPR